MNLADSARLVAALAASAVLCLAAISDIRRRLIPNWTVLALAGVFVVWTAANGGRDALSAFAAAILMLVVTFALYAFKILGAGDSKLLAATALFGGLGYLPLLVFATTLAGGAIAAVSLASRPQRALVMFTMRGKGDWGRGIPYGVAIAVGGAVILWAPMAGWVEPIGVRPKVTAEQIKHELEAPKPSTGAP